MFRLNDFIRISNDAIGKVEGIFTHRYYSKRHLFVVVKPANGVFDQQGIAAAMLSDGPEWDPILKTRRVVVGNDRLIVGLPSIHTDRLWIVPSNEDGVYWHINDKIHML